MNINLKNKIAVVTGAGGTLASVISKRLAKEGVKVLLIGRHIENIQKVADEITADGGTALCEVADVSDMARMQEIADKLEKTWGKCDYLVNAAGGNNNKAVTNIDEFDKRELSADKPDEMVGFFNVDMDAFKKVMTDNTVGTVIPTRVFGKQMAEKGNGSVINFASMNAFTPLTRNTAYAMSKSAIQNFTKWSAAYLAPAGIRVNAIAPGFFPNARSRAILGSVEEGLTARGENVMHHTPMKRFGSPEDLVGTVLYLLDDQLSAFVTGVTVPVDGGFLSTSGV